MKESPLMIKSKVFALDVIKVCKYFTKKQQNFTNKNETLHSILFIQKLKTWEIGGLRKHGLTVATVPSILNRIYVDWVFPPAMK